MNELRRHKIVWKILINPIKLFTKLVFNYSYESIRHVQGPYIMISNHNLELDPFAMGAAAHNHMYFVASEHIARKGIASKALMYFIKPIMHKKGRQGVRTVKEMLKNLQAGNSIAIFPEGNRSFNGLTGDMLPSIAKVAQRSGAKLITYKIEGGYLTQPRWSTTLRKGQLRGRLVNIYEPEKLKEMSDKEIMGLINQDLFEDAYATQAENPVAYKGKRLAYGMESTLFMCPACGVMGNLSSDDKSLMCTCGFKATYDEYGYLTETGGKRMTITEIDLLQRSELEKRFAAYNSDDPFFKDQTTLLDIGKNHELLASEQGELTVYGDRFEICGRTYAFADLEGVAVYSRNSLAIHIKRADGHIEIKGDIGFNALKYLYCFEIKEGVQQ